MLVAIPNFQGRVSPVFDVAAHLTVVRVRNRTAGERHEVTLWETRPEGIVRSLVELRVRHLICGGISQCLEHLLRQAGVRVTGQVCGAVDDVLAAFLDRTLDSPEFALPGCCCLGRTRRPPARQRSPGPRRRPSRPLSLTRPRA